MRQESRSQIRHSARPKRYSRRLTPLLPIHLPLLRAIELEWLVKLFCGSTCGRPRRRARCGPSRHRHEPTFHRSAQLDRIPVRERQSTATRGRSRLTARRTSSSRARSNSISARRGSRIASRLAFSFASEASQHVVSEQSEVPSQLLPRTEARVGQDSYPTRLS